MDLLNASDPHWRLICRRPSPDESISLSILRNQKEGVTSQLSQWGTIKVLFEDCFAYSVEL